MKITRRPITASSNSVKIPAPFDEYYRLMSDKEFEEYTGSDAHPTPCEEADGYNIKSYSYCIAKPEYEEALSDIGLDIVELVTSDWDENELMLAYTVNDRIFPVDISEVSTSIDEYNFEEGDDLYDRDTVMQAIKDEFGIDDYDAYSIYDWYAAEDAFEDFGTIEEFIDYVRSDIDDMLDAADDQLQADRIREAINSCTKVEASIDTGLQYWYLTKHGLGPGMMPKDCHLMDVVEDGWDTYILLDRMLTTSELKEYDIREKAPSDDLIKKPVESSTCEKISEDEDSIRYEIKDSTKVDSSEDFVVDYDLSYLDDPKEWKKAEERRIRRELADEAKYYDETHDEVDSCNKVQGASHLTYDDGEPYDLYDDDHADSTDDSDEIPATLNFNFDFNTQVEVKENNDWEEIDGEGVESILESAEVDDNFIDPTYFEECAGDLLAWSIPAEPGVYTIKGNMDIEFNLDEVLSGGTPLYTCDFKHSKVTDVEAIKESKTVESSTDVEATMTYEETEDAILNDKPFDIDSFKAYTGDTGEGQVKASQLEVGDTFSISNADIVDYGTILKVLSINDPADPGFDYTFHCQILQLPERSFMTLQPGDTVDIWYDADEYAGTIIPV